MPKNAVKPEAAEPTNETANSNPGGQNDLTEPYREESALGGPIFSSYGTMACRVKISGKILEASGLRANDRVEMIAGAGAIIIRKIGDPAPGLQFASTTGMTRMLDILMEATREREAEQREARERMQAYRESEAEEGLSGEQLDQETL